MTVALKKHNENLLPIINKYNCISEPKVTDCIPINDWFELIKNSEFKNQIIAARQGVLCYNKVKSSLPCVTYNFLYSEYKKDINILNSTGLIYFDIDNKEFDIDKVDTSKVFAYYKSFGGNGFAIIVRVKNLLTTNFKQSYKEISNDLGINEFIDIQAAKPSQFNVLSYDPNIFINPNAKEFLSNLDEIAPPSFVIKKREETGAYTKERGANKIIRFSSLDNSAIIGDYSVNWEGIHYYSCFIPMKKIDTGRNNFLLAYCNNFICLNPRLNKECVLTIMDNVNKRACIEPVEIKQLKRIVDSVYTYHEMGTLNPKFSKKPRKIIFNNKSTLTKNDKLEICRKEIARKKSDDSMSKLFKIFKQWDFEKLGCIRQRKVYNNFPISKKTVEKYWAYHIEFIEDQNMVNAMDGYITLFPSEFEIHLDIIKHLNKRIKEIQAILFKHQLKIIIKCFE
jgi:hypothetical protein